MRGPGFDSPHLHLSFSTGLESHNPSILTNVRKYGGSVAEWSKALVLGTSLQGGVGSNPTTASFAAQ